jgi:hypothetical protein
MENFTVVYVDGYFRISPTENSDIWWELSNLSSRNSSYDCLYFEGQFDNQTNQSSYVSIKGAQAIHYIPYDPFLNTSVFRQGEEFLIVPSEFKRTFAPLDSKWVSFMVYLRDCPKN